MMYLIGLSALVVLLLMSSAAEAQPTAVPRVGFLGVGTSDGESRQLSAFRRGLRDLGWIEHETVAIEYRWAEGSPERLPALARDLVRLKVDIIVVAGTVGIRAAKEATRTIPIVFVVLVDPVASGLVQSFSRPGGNVTGLASQFEDLVTKQPQLMKEALPGLSRIMILARIENLPTFVQPAEAAARGLGLVTRLLKVGAIGEYEDAFKTARRERAGAVQVLPSPIFGAQRRVLIDLAAKYRLPAMYEFRDYVDDGGLMSYGPSIVEMFRGLGSYIDRILKGAQPGDLPVARPTTFELAVNLKTARELGVTISPEILGRADAVIK
jgi:putative ABC transport system substrate-binding protein